MRSLSFVFASLFVLGTPVGVWAKPSPTMPVMAATPIAMGCGVGQRRDASGRCRRKFNLFRHNGRFSAFKDRHCQKVRTPNGAVNRCKI